MSGKGRRQHPEIQGVKATFPHPLGALDCRSRERAEAESCALHFNTKGVNVCRPLPQCRTPAPCCSNFKKWGHCHYSSGVRSSLLLEQLYFLGFETPFPSAIAYLCSVRQQRERELSICSYRARLMQALFDLYPPGRRELKASSWLPCADKPRSQASRY